MITVIVIWGIKLFLLRVPRCELRGLDKDFSHLINP